ncbi:gephyrin-like molybdotransferase Glp [Faucicola mancuniensis]|uniref:molybdopterin molybdotransferase MoeA n=1 Tax=Faucicola mancuniensis TaxID=1309795 RepID=UPI003977E113
MISVQDLKSAITQRCQTYLIDNPLAKRATIELPLLESSNHILAKDITASFDIPRQHLSAMDGFALAIGSDLAENSVFDVVGESCAGSPFTGTLTTGQAVRIFTGAVVPSDCDTVVMQENTNFADIQSTLDKSQPYTITLAKTANHGSNIRKQGEEVQTGETLLSTGKRLNTADISLLANLGVANVTVAKPLTVGILATGDELVQLGEPLTHLAQIYNSNTPTLKTLLKDLPIIVKDYGIIPDDLDKTTQAVEQAIDECDVIISSAGVSVGDYDFLTQVVDKLGKINHYKVAMKPGKPFVFGEFAKNNKQVLYFGLPGNPLSTIVGCLQFVRPAIWRLTGCAEIDLLKQLRLQAICQSAIRKNSGRQEFQRAYFSQHDDGQFIVTPFTGQDSHRVKQLTRANCLLVLTVERGDVAQGEMVEILPFEWQLG